MDFDALVVAVGGAARVRDLGDPAGRGLEQHGGGVDVAGRADRRVDEAGADRVHLDRLLAEQKASHVKVMDHHVAKQPARPGDVARAAAGRGRGRGS